MNNPDRPLTTRERAVVKALLSIEIDGIETFREQLDDLRVVMECDCGCPSIYFLPLEEQVVSDFIFHGTWESPDPFCTLYANRHRLMGVECLGIDDETRSEMPDPAAMTVTLDHSQEWRRR